MDTLMLFIHDGAVDSKTIQDSGIDEPMCLAGTLALPHARPLTRSLTRMLAHSPTVQARSPPTSTWRKSSTTIGHPSGGPTRPARSTNR
eukprot:3604371-Prymnesium_polylepis.1